jgi:hypothetical protein
MIWEWPSDSGKATMKSTQVNLQVEYDNSSGYNSSNLA